MHVDDRGAVELVLRQDRQEGHGLVEAVVGTVDLVPRHVRQLAGPEDALLAADPLLDLAVDHVEQLLEARVAVQPVRAAGWHAHAHELQALGVDQPRARQPFVGAPWLVLDDRFLRGDEPQAGFGAHGACLVYLTGARRRSMNLRIWSRIAISVGRRSVELAP